MWEAELAIRHYGCPVSDVSRDHPDVRIQNVSKVRLSDGSAKRLLRLTGSDDAIQSSAADFRDHERTERFVRVSDGSLSDSAYFTSEIRYDDDNPSILRHIDLAGCFQHSDVVVQHGVEHWGVYTDERDSVRTLVRSLEQCDNNVELDRSVDAGPVTDEKTIQHAALRSNLTDRQAAAFEAALALGYYENESSSTMEDIAEHLDLHRSTVGEHLKKAQNTLLTEVGKGLFPGQSQAVRQ